MRVAILFVLAILLLLILQFGYQRYLNQRAEKQALGVHKLQLATPEEK